MFNEANKLLMIGVLWCKHKTEQYNRVKCGATDL